MSKSEIQNKFEYQMTKLPNIRRLKCDVLIIGTFIFWSLFRPARARYLFRTVSTVEKSLEHKRCNLLKALSGPGISCFGLPACPARGQGFLIFDRKNGVFGQALTRCMRLRKFFEEHLCFHFQYHNDSIFMSIRIIPFSNSYRLKPIFFVEG